MSGVFNFKKEIGNNERKAVPMNNNSASENKKSQNPFNGSKEVDQLKQHLIKVEEMYVGLTSNWNQSEEKHQNIILDLEEQLKAARNSLADYQITATQEIKAVKLQMEEQKKNFSKQHEDAINERKALVAEMDANLMAQKKRTEQTTQELNKRNKELNIALQEVNFLKIQLEAEKDILKSTVKNHDQVIRFLKEQLNAAESSEYKPTTDAETAEDDAEQMTELSIEDGVEPMAEVAVDSETESTEKVAVGDEPNDALSIVPEETPIVTAPLTNDSDATNANSFPKGGDLQQNRRLTAQKTREELKQKLQGLQTLNK